MTLRTKAGVFVQAFFKGAVVLLYFISHYFAEPIYIAACLLPPLYGLSVFLFLRFCGAGRMIVARNRAKRMTKKGVISGDRRDVFYKKCIKGAAPEARAAYLLFSEGRLTGDDLALSFTRSVKVRSECLKGGMIGIGMVASLSVFLVFYFSVPLGETLFRTAICAFIASLGGVTFRFVLYSRLVAAEKAAASLAAIADGYLLRERDEESFRLPILSPRTAAEKADDASLRELRSLLRDLDREERGEEREIS